MKELIAILILFAPLQSYSQDSNSKQSRFSVGVNFSPNYSYRILKYADEFQSFVDAREEFEQPSLGFNTGIAVHYALTDNLEAELGFQFSRQTHIFKNVPILDVMSDESLGLADNQLRYHYLELPLRVNYRIINKKVFCYASVGVSMNQYLNDKSKSWLTYNNGETEVLESEPKSEPVILNPNKIVVALLGGLGFGYHLNEQWNLRFEPLFRYSLTALEEAPIEQQNYSIGCQVGVNMRL